MTLFWRMVAKLVMKNKWDFLQSYKGQCKYYPERYICQLLSRAGFTA